MMKKLYQKMTKYQKDHPKYNGFIHVLAGIGLGIMMTYPFAGEHPVRWAAAFLALSAAGHLYPILINSK